MRKFLVQKVIKPRMRIRRFFPIKRAFKPIGTITIDENSTPMFLIREISNRFGDGIYQIIGWKKTKTYIGGGRSKRDFYKIAIVDVNENGGGKFLYLRPNVLGRKAYL